QISGQLLRIGFQEGDQVTKGQVLFEIDSRPYRAALAAAEAMVARDVIQAQNAQRDVERYGALVKQEYVTPQQYDAMRASAAALEATVKQDSAAMETARLKRSCPPLRPPLARFPLPAQQLGDIRGRPTKDVEVVAQPAGTGVPVKGRLVFMDNAVDSSPRT